MGDTSAKAHQERVERGVTAVLVYLQERFPGYSVEALKRSSDDTERGARTFVVEKDRERHILRVTNEALDYAEAVEGYLHGVAVKLGQVGLGEALVVTTSETRVEPIS